MEGGSGGEDLPPPRPQRHRVAHLCERDCREAGRFERRAHFFLAFDDDAVASMAVATEPVQQMPVRTEKLPGRNEPCFCGSGKKYKLCHGR